MRTLSRIVDNKVRRFDFTVRWTGNFESDCKLLHAKMKEAYPLAHALFAGKRIHRYRENGIPTTTMADFRFNLNKFLYGFPHWANGIICAYWVNEGIREVFNKDVLTYYQFKENEPFRANNSHILEIFVILGSPTGKGQMENVPDMGLAFVIERK